MEYPARTQRQVGRGCRTTPSLLQGFQAGAPTSLGTVNVVEAAITCLAEFTSSMVNSSDGEALLTFTGALRAIADSAAVPAKVWLEAMDRLCASIGTESQQREVGRGRFYTTYRQHLQAEWREESLQPSEATLRFPIIWLVNHIVRLAAQVRKSKTICLNFGYFVDWHGVIHKDQRAVQRKVVSDGFDIIAAKRTAEPPRGPAKRPKASRCLGCGGIERM